MNRQEIITEYAKMYNITKTKAAEHIDMFINFIKEELLVGENLNFKNFGKFGVKQIAERNVRVPNAEMIVVKEHYKPIFKFSDVFRDEVKASIK